MIPTTMQQAIDNEYGTFEETVHDDLLIDESAMTDPVVVLPSSRIYSYDTGYMDMSWIITDVEWDEDEE